MKAIGGILGTPTAPKQTTPKANTDLLNAQARQDRALTERENKETSKLEARRRVVAGNQKGRGQGITLFRGKERGVSQQATLG